MKKNKLLICWTAFVLPDERKEMPPSYRIVAGSLPSWCHALLNRQEVDKILRQQPAPLLDNKRKSSFCFSTAAIIYGNPRRSNEFELLFIENKKYYYLIFSVYHTDNLTQYTCLNWINDWTIFCKKKQQILFVYDINTIMSSHVLTEIFSARNDIESSLIST